MSHIELKLVADNASDMSTLIAGLHAQLQGDAPVVIGRIAADVTDHAGNDPELEKPKPARARTTAAPAAEAKGESAPTGTAAPADEAGKSGTASTGTASQAGSSDEGAAIAYADVQKATNQLVAKKGRTAAISVLATFDATKGQDLTEAQWGPYIEACTLAMEG